MAVDLAYLPNVFKVDDATSELVDRSIIQESDTGIEFRVRLDPFPRKMFKASWPKTKVDEVERFYEANGRHTPFLVYAPRSRDHASTNEPLKNTTTGLLLGDGSTTTFQFQISRSNGVRTVYKDILHPKSGTVGTIKVNSVTKTETTDYTVTYTTGIVTFSSAPGNGHTVIAPTIEWYWAMRFDSAQMVTKIRQAFAANEFAEVQDTDLIEVFGE